MTAQELIQKIQEADPKSEVRVMYPDGRLLMITYDITVEADEEDDEKPIITIQAL